MEKQVDIGKMYISGALCETIDLVRTDLGLKRNEKRPQMNLDRDIRPLILEKIKQLLTQSVPPPLERGLNEWASGIARNSIMRSTNVHKRIHRQLDAHTKQGQLRDHPEIVRGICAIEKFCSRQAAALALKTQIMPAVTRWFCENDIPMDTTMIDMTRMGSEAFSQRVMDIVESRIDEHEGADAADVFDAYDIEFKEGTTVSSALRRGTAMLIAWRMEHSQRGFIIDEEN